MARPTQDAIETFMSVTGVSEAVAVQKLEEHGGDLNQAVNAHFGETERINSESSSLPATHDDTMDIDEPFEGEAERPPFSLFSATSTSRSFNPFSLLDEQLGSGAFSQRGTDTSNNAPRVSHPIERWEIPIEFKDGDNQSTSHEPTIVDISGTDAAVGPEVIGHVSVDEEDEDIVAQNAHGSDQDGRKYDHMYTYGAVPEPSAPQSAIFTDNDDIEEEMLKAAIEASKLDAERYSNIQFSAPDTSEQVMILPERGDNTVKRENVSSVLVDVDEGVSPSSNQRQEIGASNTETSWQNFSKDGSTFLEDTEEDAMEQPLIRHRPRRNASLGGETGNAIQLDDSLPSSPRTNDIGPQPSGNGGTFHSAEWGGISSEEHDEAVMLEAAMFGGIPETGPYNFSYSNHQEAPVSSRHNGFYPRVARPPSPSLAAQRLLREQQDDEYLAALQADREKELKALQEAELRHQEEAAAREAALQEERHQAEETRRKLLAEEESEREIAVKQASLPQEPSSDDENAVTLLVRMPDGSRRGRRFLKSDKLRSLFDFIDIGRVVKPRSYKLVRPYPRQAFGEGDGDLSLKDLGLTSKQEALFLELM